MKTRATAIVLAMSFLFGGIEQVNGMSTEELIFEKPPYVEAAKAAARGDVAALEALIGRGLDVNYEGKETKTPWGKDTLTLLLWATVSENVKAVEMFLKAGADPNKSTRRGMTALIMATGMESEELFDLLLVRYKANPNAIYDGSMRTALMVALRERKLGENRFERADKLLAHSADVDLAIDRGETAAVAFSRLQDWRAVFWLLEHGADHERRDSVGGSIMCYLRSSYRTNTLAPSEAFTYRDKVRDWLLAKGIARARIDPTLHPSPKCDD